MKDRFSEMIDYKMAKTTTDSVNAIKQILQEIVLSGLSRGGFFNKAAFNGGTSLRIIYGLERFSEDLDFGLIERDPDFTFDRYIPQIKTEFDAMGIDVMVTEKAKNIETSIKTSHLKCNARELVIGLSLDNSLLNKFAKDQKVEIKIEVDTDPPKGARLERRIQCMPMFYTLTMYDLPTLFAGKVSALLCRTYLHRVKGRDMFDYIWYVKNNVPLNIEHAEQRMKKTGCISEDTEFNVVTLRKMLVERFRKLDYTEAKKDIKRFVIDRKSIDDWCSDYFIAFTESIRVADYSKALVSENGEHSSFGPDSKANILIKKC